MLEPFALISLAWLFLLLVLVASGYHLCAERHKWAYGACLLSKSDLMDSNPSDFNHPFLSYSAFWTTFCQDLFASLGCSSSSVSFNKRRGFTPIANGETLLLEILFLMRSAIMLLVATKLSIFTPCWRFKMFFQSRYSPQDGWATSKCQSGSLEYPEDSRLFDELECGWRQWMCS